MKLLVLAVAGALTPLVAGPALRPVFAASVAQTTTITDLTKDYATAVKRWRDAWMVDAADDYFDSRTAVVEKKAELVAQLLREHADAAWAADELIELLPHQRVWFDETWVRARLEELAKTSRNKEVTAAAWYELAQRLTISRATEEDRQQGQALLARIESEFAGTKAADKVAQKKQTASYEVGGTPPDFEAKDVDGASFKLSDYRGKVVMLDFWGFW
jgi:hypothetical protein